MLAIFFSFAGAMCAFAEDEYIPNTTTDSVNVSFAAIGTIEADLNKKSFEITAEKITDHSAVLKWNSEQLYSGYKICKQNVINNKWEEYAKTTNNEINIKKLSADTSYCFSILNGATEEVLGAIQFQTAVKAPVLKIKDKTSKKIVLSLGKHKKNETVVIYRKAPGKKFKKIGEVTGKSTFTDKKLKGNTNYSYKAKTITKKGKTKLESAFSKVVKTKTLLKMGLPSVSGKTKTFAYYTAVTARSSPQYKLLNSNKCTTDKETGIRMVDDCYCVALGSYYGTKIGTKYKITFSNGNTIKVILCDQKANRHTDSKHQYAVNNKDIVEFYVQRNMMPRAIRGRGNYGILKQFSGSIVSIEKYMD